VARAPTDIRSLARQQTLPAIRTLTRIMHDADQPGSARVLAANSLLDRGWGKAAQPMTGENGEGGIEVVIRHILEGGEQPRTIDVTPEPALTQEQR